MDPLCHTLVGASLAETRLGRGIRVAMPTLLVAANLPDIDVLAYAAGGDAALGFRRGWTHGVLAMVVLPVVLALVVAAIDRWRCRRTGLEPVPLAPIVTLSFVGVLSHPALDWLNVYGVRLLMPFDGRWFYGDVLFIVDAWLWLALGLAVAYARRGRRPSGWSWVALAALVATLVVRATPEIGGSNGWIWLAVLGSGAAVVWRSASIGPGSSRHRAVELVMAGCALYVGLMLVGRIEAERAATGLGGDGSVMAAPLPLTPVTRDLVVLDGDEYVVGRVDWGDDRATVTRRIPVGPDDELVRRAWDSDAVAGFRLWARFPWAEIEPLDDTTVRVWLGDARYARTRTSGFGGAVVDLTVEPSPAASPP